MKVKLCMEQSGHNEKMGPKEMGRLTSSIGEMERELELYEVATLTGEQGYSCCFASLNGPKRCSENFKEMQLFALDFDSGISFHEVHEKATQYGLPIQFAYYTFSSTDSHERFRVVFLHKTPIKYSNIAGAICSMLVRIFPSDKNCKDPVRLFLGGKGLIYYNTEEESFDLERLCQCYQQYEFSYNAPHCKRAIDNFARRYNIALINERLAIGDVCLSGIAGEKIPETHLIYIVSGKKSPIPIFIGYQLSARTKTRGMREDYRMRVRQDDKNRLASVCKLFRDFQDGKPLSHNEKFLLLTNLRYMESGRKIFFHYLKDQDTDYTEWEYQADYIRRMDYRPQGCETDTPCPYCNECCHKTNMVLTYDAATSVIERIGDKSEYVSIKHAHDAIQNAIRDAIHDGSKWGISLIKAQTGIGKTSCYCDIAANDVTHNYIIALPTNLLKREVAIKLRLCNDVYVTPSFDELGLPGEVIERIQYGYEIFEDGIAHREIYQFVVDNRDSKDPDTVRAVLGCENYLRMGSRLEERPRIILTTHARLLRLSEEVIRDYKIIVDEDILLTIFKSTMNIKMDELQKCGEYSDLPEELEVRIAEILGADGNSYGRFAPLFGLSAGSCIPKALKKVRCLLSASSYYVEKERQKVQVFMNQTLKRGQYIILSATLNATVYRMYFSKFEERIHVYEVPACRYKGKLVQYAAHPLSRSTCEQFGFPVIMEAVRKIAGDIPVITFKRYYEEMNKSGLALNGGGLYFGNELGSNCLTGQDIAVVGTPHSNEIAYKLIAKHLGLEVTDTLHRESVRYNGYHFKLATYSNPKLQELQLYVIHSELEQAIGRARLLREDCTVYLFSNLPCEQAEFIYKDYLVDQNDSLEEDEAE